MLEPDFICIVDKFLYNVFKILFVTDVNSVKTFDQIGNISNELEFFFTTFDNCPFLVWIYSSRIKIFTI